MTDFQSLHPLDEVLINGVPEIVIMVVDAGEASTLITATGQMIPQYGDATVEPTGEVASPEDLQLDPFAQEALRLAQRDDSPNVRRISLV